jgi:hypothetical protein
MGLHYLALQRTAIHAQRVFMPLFNVSLKRMKANSTEAWERSSAVQKCVKLIEWCIYTVENWSSN